jgi:hypothetical protein
MQTGEAGKPEMRTNRGDRMHSKEGEAGSRQETSVRRRTDIPAGCSGNRKRAGEEYKERMIIELKGSVDHHELGSDRR